MPADDEVLTAADVTRPEPTSARWSTRGIEPQDAFAVWRELISSTFVPLAATVLRREAFRASIDHSGGPDLQLSTVRADAHEIRRVDELVDRADDAYLMATIQVTGRSTVNQDGREIELVPGSMVFCDSTRPFGFIFADPFEQLVVQMPRTVLQARSGLSDRATQRATTVRLDPTGPIPVITGFLSSLASVSLRDPDDAAVLGQHALGLIGMANSRARSGEKIHRACRLRAADDDGVADAELVLMPEERPAGPAAVEVCLGGVIVGDVTFRVCRSCRLAVVEHVRVESRQRRRRLAALAINFLVSRWSDYRWTTSPIDDTAESVRPNAHCRQWTLLRCLPGTRQLTSEHLPG
ncbi:hypothetical protein MOQ72_41210 [Saccharopolyspora sp. K220]|uniref:cupin domain-containing protein n=1 Tax=Saccharopolyspora soli TaxID=2926618 RepID=UPI001F58D78B|nr:hypothetical protein [Saccharopolyspora soli]MCI2423843.1 hypothetical protein [Saccharopolyspora soli]